MPNPFRGVTNPRAVWAWGMFDLANQSFTLLINTLLFALFFKEVVVADPGRDDTLWSLLIAVSMSIVVIVSPILGAIADARRWKKRFLLGSGALCAALTCSLALIPPGALWVAIALYIPANIAYGLGENFLASFLPEIARKEQIGRVSGIGWTMGYVGALALLALTGAATAIFSLGDPSKWRPLFVFAGVWFFIMALPTALFLPEKRETEASDHEGNLLAQGVLRLRESVREARRYKQLTRMLTAFLVYGFGVQVIIFFAAVLARDAFGFGASDLVRFIAMTTVAAGVGAVLTSMKQDQIGHRRTILIHLVIWTANASAMALLAALGAQSRWMLWIVGAGIGFGIGGIGTASRAMVGYLTPSHKSAEFFGLWGLTYKLAGVIGVLSFGVMKDEMGTVAALVMLAVFFLAGLALLLRVDEQAGFEAAAEAEREHAIKMGGVEENST